MGACGTKQQAKVEPIAPEAKMALLGGANVGKSTVFKQMKLLYSGGFSHEDRIWARGCIIENILETLCELDMLAESMNLAMEEGNEDLIDEIKVLLLEFRSRDQYKDHPCVEIWESIKRFWNDQAIQTAFDQATNYAGPQKTQNLAIQDSSGYFLHQLDRISLAGFVPSDADILFLRRSTSDPSTISFEMRFSSLIRAESVLKVTCTDVGGQAHERAEWSKHTEGVNAIIYVAALSEFNVVRPDGQNSLQAQFNLLETVCSSPCFQGATIIVLLNKSDLLEKKLKRVQVHDYFPEYEGENDLESVYEFFEEKVMQIRQDGQAANTLRTCATDTELMQEIMTSVGQALLEQTLSNPKYFG